MKIEIKKSDALRKLIYWSYSNLAMAHSAVKNNQVNYEKINFIIRTRLFNGLTDGSMNIKSLFEDEKIKLQTGQICNYCGSEKKLALDHIFPQAKGGLDIGDNLIYACKTCNSSKGKKDLFKWFNEKEKFPTLMIIRRYLKIIFKYSEQNNLLDKRIKDLENLELPFEIGFIPIKFPKPSELKINISDGQKFKIINWNIERPKKNTSKTKRVLKKLNEENADIIVLTESSNAVDLSKTHPYSYSSEPFQRTPDEQWVVIWSKYKITKKVETFNKNRTLCCNIKLPNKEITIYGTIIPYHMAGVKGERYGELGYKNWEYHEKDIYSQSEDWKKIIENEKLPLMIIGDFNQTRFKNIGYGTRKVRALLTEKLNENNLECVTEIDFSEKFLTPDPKKQTIRKNVDHICVSNEFLKEMKNYNVGAWNNFDENNLYMSDHNGIYLEFEL